MSVNAGDSWISISQRASAADPDMSTATDSIMGFLHNASKRGIKQKPHNHVWNRLWMVVNMLLLDPVRNHWLFNKDYFFIDLKRIA